MKSFKSTFSDGNKLMKIENQCFPSNGVNKKVKISNFVITVNL